MLNLVLAVLGGKLWTHKESAVFASPFCVQCKMRTELSHVHKYPLESDACFMSVRSAGPFAVYRGKNLTSCQEQSQAFEQKE